MKYFIMVLLLAVPVGAVPITVFSTFGPDGPDDYDTTWGYAVGNVGVLVSVPRYDFQLTGIRLAVNYLYADGWGHDGASPFTLSLCEDQDGLPGAVLEEWGGLDTNGPFTTPEGWDHYNQSVVIPSVVQPSLDHSRNYWLYVSTDPEDWVVWNFSHVNSPASFSSYSASQDRWYIWENNPSTAYALEGEVLAKHAPEASTLALLGLGLLGAWTVRRKDRR